MADSREEHTHPPEFRLHQKLSTELRVTYPQRLLALIPPWARASVLVIGLSIIGKVIGLLRELESARLFGVGAEMDAFVAASTLILFMARMGSDSLQVNTPKVVSEYTTQEASIPWGDLFRALLFLSGLLMFLSLVVLPPLVPVLFGGLGRPEQHLAFHLLTRMLPMTICWAVIGGFSGILHTQHRYGQHQIALMVASIAVVASLWLFADQLGIDALAWGWTLGMILGAVVVILPLWKQSQDIWTWQGWNAQWSILRKLLRASAGQSLWFALNHVPLWVERYYAAKLPEGSLSALGYAQRLFQLPLEMVTAVVMSVWIVRIVQVSHEKVARHTFRLMGRLAVISFPIALLLAFTARPLITFTFARGAFGQQAVETTTGPFAMYALGFGFHALSGLLVRTFQARGVVRYPLLAVMVDIVLTILLNAVAYRGAWGAVGIALSNTVVAGARVFILGACMAFTRIREK